MTELYAFAVILCKDIELHSKTYKIKEIMKFICFCNYFLSKNIYFQYTTFRCKM